jgi:VWFA-related protein
MFVARLAVALCALAVGVIAASPGYRDSQTQGTPQQGAPPAFKAKTAVVPVTVTAVDGQGKPVVGLTQADFEVFENGKRREIAAFHAQSMVKPAAPGNGRIAPATRRNFLIIFGLGRIEEPTNAFDGLGDFLTQHVLPQDQVALMGFHRVTSLTTDHAAIRAIVERFRREHARYWREIVDFVLATHHPPSFSGPPLPNEVLDGIDRDIFGAAALAAPDSTGNRVYVRTTANLLLNIDSVVPIKETGWLQRGKRVTSFKSLQDAVVSGGFSLKDATVVSTRLKYIAGVEYLRQLEGEKRIVILAQDPITLSYVQGQKMAVDNIDAFVRRANDARITVDFIWTGGTRLTRDSGCSSCRDLAERTGGHYTSLDEVGPALARVDELSRESYLMGYVPPDGPHDGAYREIEVRTKRPGVRLIYRAGYYAVPEVAPDVIVQRTAAARQNATEQYELDVDDIPVTLSVEPVAVRDGRQVVTAHVTIDTSRLLLRSEGAVRTAELDLKVFVGDSRQRVIASEVQPVQIRQVLGTPAPPERDFQRTFVLETAQLPAYVKVVAYEYGTDRLGSRSVKLPGQKRP